MAAPLVVPGASPAQTRGPAALTPQKVAFWESTWAKLAKIDSTEPRTRGEGWNRQVSEMTRTRVDRRASMPQDDDQEMFRLALLEWHQDRIDGDRLRPIEAPSEPVAWLAREPWLAARALVPGAVRTEAMLLALRESAAGDFPARLALATAQTEEELALGHLELAVALARQLDALASDPVSARRRAWCETQAGRPEPFAHELSARRAAAPDDGQEAHYGLTLARTALARGDELGARALAGAALVLGSPDAAVLLGRLALAGGEPDTARVVARAWVDGRAERDVPGAVWALALLPARFPPPSPGSPVR